MAWEQAIERCLMPSEQGVLYPKFNAGALLRGSLKDQAAFFAQALGAGGSKPWMTQNEVRQNFDLNKDPSGNELPAQGQGAAPVSAPDPAPQPAPKKKEPA